MFDRNGAKLGRIRKLNRSFTNNTVENDLLEIECKFAYNKVANITPEGDFEGLCSRGFVQTDVLLCFSPFGSGSQNESGGTCSSIALGNKTHLPYYSLYRTYFSTSKIRI